MASLDALQTFARSCLHRSGGPEALQGKIELVLEELLVNVFNYAYPRDCPGQVTLCCRCEADRLAFIIKDRGAAFDPLERATADTSLDIEQRPIGGLGIHLVRNMADSIVYERRDGFNVLTVTFSLSQ
ncbi:ATP-binding protein [Desulfoplanes formicivorans]|nr:ATP-binding protein [Desulfoplanes formicivorans]